MLKIAIIKAEATIMKRSSIAASSVNRLLLETARRSTLFDRRCRAREQGERDVRHISARSSSRNRLALEQRNRTETQGPELSPFDERPPATQPQIQIIGQGKQIAV